MSLWREVETPGEGNRVVVTVRGAWQVPGRGTPGRAEELSLLVGVHSPSLSHKCQKPGV